MKINKMILLILCIYLFTAVASGASASSRSLIPQKPFWLTALEKRVNILKNAQTLLFFDDLLQASGLLESVFSLLKFDTAVIEPQRASSRRMAGHSVKVVTANMLLFPPPFFFNQAERIKEFAKSVADLSPDIIMLQEVWDINCLHLIAKEFPDYWMTFSSAIPINFSGLVTLSRLPVTKAYTQKYAPSLRFNFEELLAFKGFIVTTVTSGDHQFDIINSHLYSASPSQKYRPNCVQFMRLQNLVIKSDKPVIFGGDMNLLPEEINRLLLPEFIANSCMLPTAGLRKRTKKLDWLFVYPGKQHAASLESGRLEWPVEFSDHSPVYGKIIFSQLDEQ